MFENIMKFFNKFNKKQDNKPTNSREAAKERLHLVLMQDRANVSADFLELMKQEIIEVIKKYIDVDESAIDVRLTNKENEDGTNKEHKKYTNIQIINIKNEARKIENTKKEEEKNEEQDSKKEEKQEKNENKKQEEKQDKKENKKEIKEQTEKETQKKEEDKGQEDKQPNKEETTQIKEDKEQEIQNENAEEEIKSKK